MSLVSLFTVATLHCFISAVYLRPITTVLKGSKNLNKVLLSGLLFACKSLLILFLRLFGISAELVLPGQATANV